MLGSENPPGIYEHTAEPHHNTGNELAVEASLRRLMTLRSDGPNWHSISQSMIDEGYNTDAACCEATWLELMQRKPLGSLPAAELEKRFWSLPGRRVDVYDSNCWRSGVTVADASARAGLSAISMDSGEVVTIKLPDHRVRLSLFLPPSSTMSSVRFIPDAVRTVADVSFTTIDGSKYCSLRDLVLLLRGRHESQTHQQPAAMMASDQMALDLMSILHPSEFLPGISVGNEVSGNVVNFAGVKKILQRPGMIFDRVRLSQLDTQLLKGVLINVS